MKSLVLTTVCAALLGGCVTAPPLPPHRSTPDPSDPAAPQASTRPLSPNLVATTRIYLDPSAGADAQKMEHGNMQGMGGMQGMDHSQTKGMEGMDHSKMQGMENKPPAGASPPAQAGGMQGMDHSKMPGMEAKQSPAGASSPPAEGMKGMDHSKMPGMGAQQPSAASPPPSKEALEMEMKKTSDEMKELSDELKKKFDAAKAEENSSGESQPAASPAAVYTCPIHPEVKQPNPGKCPKCGMKLVPKSSAK